MNDDEKFLFDLEGYLILRNVLTADEVARCNAAIDHHRERFFETDRALEGESEVLGGAAKQKWMEGMLAWDRPWCEPFRALMVHSRLKPYLAEVLGGAYRLDHGPLLIAMNKGEGGHLLHGGGVERQDFSQTYLYQFGKIYCGLTVVEFILADEGPGDGGLALVPCGHKTNFPMPQSLSFYEQYQEYVKEVHLKAGDVVIFTEALTHGTLVWQGDHQRRALIYKYSPRFQYVAEGYHQAAYPDFIKDMTEEQRAMMPPPA
jgi:hypothetical protein